MDYLKLPLYFFFFFSFVFAFTCQRELVNVLCEHPGQWTIAQNVGNVNAEQSPTSPPSRSYVTRVPTVCPVLAELSTSSWFSAVFPEGHYE